MITPGQLVARLRQAARGRTTQKKRVETGERGGTGSVYDVLKEKIATLTHQLHRLRQRLQQLKKLYEEDEITAETFHDELRSLKEEQEHVLAETHRLREQIPDRRAQREPGLLEKLRELEEALKRLKHWLEHPEEEGMHRPVVDRRVVETPREASRIEIHADTVEHGGEAEETGSGQERGEAEEEIEGIGVGGEDMDVEPDAVGGPDIPSEPVEEDLSDIDVRYPLTPSDPAKGEVVYAWAHITYSEEDGELQYLVDEPELTPEIRDVLDEVEEILKETIDVDFSSLQEEEAQSFLEDRIREIVEEYDFGLDDERLQILEYYATRDFIGLGKIQPLMNDSEIEDISCDGIGIPLYVYHRDPRIGSVKTNVAFNDEDELDSFIIKLAQRCGRSVSVAEPLLDGALPDGSRVQATLATDIARRGSNFTIRRFTEDPLTPVHMMGFGTVDAEMLAYCWMLIEYGKSILIAGPTASGKTSMLNALSLFIRPELKIVSIEDSIGGDTAFTYRNAGEMHTGMVGDYIDRQIEEHGHRVASGHEVAENRTGLQVPTIDHEGKMTFARPSALIRHTVEKDMYQVQTETGKQIETTEDHSLYILGPDPEKMDAGPFLEALVGETDRRPWNRDMEIDLGNYRGQLEEDGYREITGQSYTSRKSSICRTLHLDEAFMELLGFIVTRGSTDPEKKTLSLPASNPRINQILTEKAAEIGFTLVEKENRYRISSGTFYHALEAIGLRLEADQLSRRTPEWTVNLGEPLQNAFVNGFKKGNKRPMYYLEPCLCKAKVGKLDAGDYVVTARRMPAGPGVETIDVAQHLEEENIQVEEEEDEIRIGENTMPKHVEVDEALLEFIGVWVADGCYDENNGYVIQSAPATETRALVEEVGDRYGLTVQDHSDGFSQNVYGKIFYLFMKNALNLEHGSGKKRFPDWVFELDEEQTAAILRGYFAGDNDDTDKELGAASVNRELLEQVQTLLLRFGVRSHIIEKENHYSLRISGIRNLRNMERIGFLREERRQRFTEITSEEEPGNDKQDVVDLPRPFLWRVINQCDTLVGEEWTYNTWKTLKDRYKNSRPGRNFLTKLAEDGDLTEPVEQDLRDILESDYRFEKIAGITGETKEQTVYDFSVPPEERFLAGNFLCANTPELRLPHPHWIPETSRAGYGFGEEQSGEVTLHDLLKESLRQRPDYIIVGEVRGKEAYVLFQQIASIPGEEDVLVLNDDNLKRVPIEDVDPENVTGVPTMEPETGDITIEGLERTTTHEHVDNMYRVKTGTGREVVTTGNHSVFTGTDTAAAVTELEPGDDILVPARLPHGYNDIDQINLLDLDGIRVHAPGLVKEAQETLGFKAASAAVDRTTISNYYEADNCALPADKFTDLMEEAGIEYEAEDVTVRYENRSTEMPGMLPVTPELLRFLGYFIADGNLNTAGRNNAIQLYNSDEDILADMRHCINEICGKETRERTRGEHGSCTELAFSNKVLFEFLRQEVYRDGKKQVPDFVFGLSKERIGDMLAGLYSGDGHIRRKGFAYFTTNRRLANDVNTLLLSLGIMPRIRTRDRDGREKTDYEIVFHRQREMGAFLNYADPRGVDPPDVERCEWGRDKHVFTDEITGIEEVAYDKQEPVHDLSVPGTQNFIGGFGGVMLHNTGHPGMSTIHASSLDKVMDRLTTKPINLPANLIANIDLLLFMRSIRYQDKHIRRVIGMHEVKGYDEERKNPVTDQVFAWKPREDVFESTGKSTHLTNITAARRFDADYIKQELDRRRKVLEWMQNQGMYDYRRIGKVVSAYYVNPDNVLQRIEAGQ